MKIKTPIISIAVFLWATAYTSMVRAETLPRIIISEISIAGNDTDDDFIELYNMGDIIVSLNNWHICRRTKNNTSPCTGSNLIKKFSSNDAILPKKFLLWANSKGKKYIDLADIKTADSLTDNNSLALLDDTDTLIDSVTWGSGHADPFLPSILYPDNPPKNKSLIRNITTPNFSLSDKPTPTNSKDETYKDPLPTIYNNLVRLNEILPNPSEKGEANEFIELYNNSDEIISLIGWSIRKDSSTNGQYIIQANDFPQGTNIVARGFFLIPRNISGFVMANSNKTISLHDPKEKEISAVSYRATKEDVSLNYTATGWRGGTPTPGAENILNNLPETQEKVPKKGYRGTPVTFNARGKDSDGDTLKYIWNFGDGHKSYKEKTSHKYEGNGVYTITLTTTDGSDDVTETFALKIESYPHPKIRITSLIPNPTGKDTDNEWLMLENKGKKNVNLKGFGIATGWKNLVNHPIREDFMLKPQQETKLTRTHSLFTLPNQKGKVELRAPDGKVLQKIKYKLEKSIAEDITYQKKKGERWSFEKTAEEPADTNTEIAPPPSEEENPMEEPAPTPDINTQPEEENKEENSDFQETEKLEGAVLGASTIAETPPVLRDDIVAIPQKQEYSIVFWLRQAFTNINAYLNNMRDTSQN